MATFTAIYDANVLYPAPLRDLLMELALTDLFRARWTDQIHDEWIRNVLADRPDLTREQLTRTKEMMDSHVRDCLVTGYENLILGLELPDPGDRHVLAAAIRCHADVIVTYNLKDYPADVLAEFELEAQHPPPAPPPPPDGREARPPKSVAPAPSPPDNGAQPPPPNAAPPSPPHRRARRSRRPAPPPPPDGAPSHTPDEGRPTQPPPPPAKGAPPPPPPQAGAFTPAPRERKGAPPPPGAAIGPDQRRRIRRGVRPSAL